MALLSNDGRVMTAHYQRGPLVYCFGRHAVIDLQKPDAMSILGASGDPWEMTQDGTGIVNYWYDGSGKDVAVEQDPYVLKELGEKIHRELTRDAIQEVDVHPQRFKQAPVNVRLPRHKRQK